MTAMTPGWQVIGQPHVRTCALRLATPGAPDLTGTDTATWRHWARQVWAEPAVAEAITHASPALAAGVASLCSQEPADVSVKRARKTTAALLRYLLRIRHRATPFGLFAGVAPTKFTESASAEFGTNHQRLARVNGAWMAQVLGELVSLPQVRERLHLAANNTVTEQDGAFTVAQFARSGPDTDPGEVRIGATPPVRLVLDKARTPTSWNALVQALISNHPGGSPDQAEDMLARLLSLRALHPHVCAPLTAQDPLQHLLSALTRLGGHTLPQARPWVSRLEQVHSLIRSHNRGGADPNLLRKAQQAVDEFSPGPPLGVDVRVDASITLPCSVARSAEQAAHLLGVLSPHPEGLPAWQGYRERFTGRYGDRLVPLAEILDPQGLGLPPAHSAPVQAAGGERVGLRERWLLKRAQAAALEGEREVLVDELVRELAASRAVRPPEHTELNLRIESPSITALESGRFRLAVLGASRAMATMVGRFTALTSTTSGWASLLSHSMGAVPVQLSFPPVRAASAHVAHAPQLAEHLLHIGEYPGSSNGSLAVEDLAVGDDGRELFLWSHTLDARVEPFVPHALNLRYAPPLARFLAELPRANRTVLTGFDWGTASVLPFLPRLRWGNLVLADARWRITATELPPPSAAWPHWHQAWSSWARQRRLPEAVELGAGDQRLRLDLSEPGCLFLLRTHLNKEDSAVLTQAPSPTTSGWCRGRPVEVVLQLRRETSA
ncbi:lantibiotic dehydratase family protein [Nocardiopsis exhalans]|uniref:Lantibiotic dehydratase family protein n=1 Tax=Nocardiopsis exhalans TaxID=163604 RepID=A0ABY5D5U7_9ACTN|nr:lantibiotic dehydratase family protein [Nocardiopsis exhalans]USY18760.1 lantibiotic dehydratase family protein [Nocardiopsis exhalans]